MNYRSLYIVCMPLYSLFGRDAPVGIQNIGLSCYMNANMQALLVTPFFVEVDALAKQQNCAKNPFIDTLQEFKRAYDSLPNGEAITPKYSMIPLEKMVQIYPTLVFSMLQKLLDFSPMRLMQRQRAKTAPSHSLPCRLLKQ